MIAWIRRMFEKHREIILYLFFGALTTAVNWAVHFPLYNLLKFPSALSNAIAWAVSVLFSFLTNKPFVFQSKDWSKRVVLPEFAKFLSCRFGSGLLETLAMLLTVDIMHLDGNIMKIIVSVFVVIINYVGSKFLFKKK